MEKFHRRTVLERTKRGREKEKKSETKAQQTKIRAEFISRAIRNIRPLRGSKRFVRGEIVYAVNPGSRRSLSIGAQTKRKAGRGEGGEGRGWRAPRKYRFVSSITATRLRFCLYSSG